MKKLYGLFVFLFVNALACCPVFADIALSPMEEFAQDFSPVILSLAVAVILIAVALIVRAVVKKKRKDSAEGKKK